MLIIAIPPAIGKRKAFGISQRELDRVLEYLGRYPQESLPADIFDRIAKDVLLDSFGWPCYQGKVRLLQILARLEKDGAITCERAGRKSIITSAKRLPPKAAPAVLPKAKKNNQRWLKPFKPVKLGKPLTTEKGEARDRRRRGQIGENNESRFFTLANRLAELLASAFPDTVVSAHADRSGRHNPAKGKIDLQDHHGEDVSLRLTVKAGPGGHRNAWLIYDVKTSCAAAIAFNAHIKRFPGQTSATLKRAITVNQQRTDREIIGEVLEDLEKTGTLALADHEKILHLFQD